MHKEQVIGRDAILFKKFVYGGSGDVHKGAQRLDDGRLVLSETEGLVLSLPKGSGETILLDETYKLYARVMIGVGISGPRVAECDDNGDF